MLHKVLVMYLFTAHSLTRVCSSSCREKDIRHICTGGGERLSEWRNIGNSRERKNEGAEFYNMYIVDTTIHVAWIGWYLE